MRPIITGLLPAFAALAGLSLCCCTWRSTKSRPPSATEISLHKEARRLYSAGEYTRAHETFRSAALQAERDGSLHEAAMNWNDAGGAALVRLDFREALPDFLKAREVAEKYALRQPWLVTMNNLAAFYLQIGNPQTAMRVAKEALATVHPGEGGGASSRLRFQLANALSRMRRFDEAEPIYRKGIAEIAAENNLEDTARALLNYGRDSLDADRIEQSDDALTEAFRLVRIHHLTGQVGVLIALARLKSRQGDPRSASALFNAAVRAPDSFTPQWRVYADRGEFRLAANNLPGAIEDFRQARRIAAKLRADVVPADQDRIALEGGLDRVAGGLIDAGNRLAIQTSDNRLLRETFDAAEQDRLWSLRALVPTPNDWRTRLPSEYWDLLARYQGVERALLARSTPELDRKASALQLQLQQLEAAANGQPAGVAPTESAIAHASDVLDRNTVLFSFHVSKASGWLWAVDRSSINVYPIPALDSLKAAVSEFAEATRKGDSRSDVPGRNLYKLLFGQVSNRYLAHKRWLLEPDGPLFDLPFAALVPDGPQNTGGEGKNEPTYLFEKAVLETIPGALLLESRKPFEDGPFLGVGDPIYNAADSRYQGRARQQEIALPRLTASAAEVRACSRAWNPARALILTGADASLAKVRTALHGRPAVIHFATHVVRAPQGYSSGLIALSLDRSGAMGLMGPAEIVANTVSPDLVVLDGCDSGQGDALPASGLMGLTRAWIGAGARSVVATAWEIPDNVGSEMLVDFYRVLRQFPERGPAFALQQAQISFYTRNKVANSANSRLWGAYFVLGRG